MKSPPAFLRFFPYVSLVALFLPVHADARQIKVACMGDSITYGAGITATGTSPATWDGDKYIYSGPTLLDQDSYPADLQALLGDGYDVRNFGASGRTVTGPGSGLNPYIGSMQDGNTPSGGYTAGVSFVPKFAFFWWYFARFLRLFQSIPPLFWIILGYPALTVLLNAT